MQSRALAIPGVKLITPEMHYDERGSFSETFNLRAMAALGIREYFVQDNQSLSRNAGVVRGLHFQIPPRAQGKLVRVVRGAIFDVVVDVRAGSPMFGKHVSAVLNAENGCQLWVPRGFAHGFCTLEPYTEVAYKVTDYYVPECDRGLRWDDSQLGIPWPVSAGQAIVSTKDKAHPRLADVPFYFKYER